MRVCIDARISEGRAGGIEQFIIGLASGLGQLASVDEEYLFLTTSGQDSWLRPYIRGACRLVEGPSPSRTDDLRELAALVVLRALGGIAHLRDLPPPKFLLRDDLVGHLRPDVLHFTRQKAYLTSYANIYHPHDLQHLHLPDYFGRVAGYIRELRCSTYCRQAVAVVVASTWVQRDVIRAYGLRGEKVPVVPLAPPIANYPEPTEADLERLRTAMSLPKKFAFYAAQTWPHKNHQRLLDAMAMLRDHHRLVVPLVCCGAMNKHFEQIRAHIRALGLDEQTRFIGYVSPAEIHCLYRLAHAVVMPSRFEAGSFPVLEAFAAGTPVACSSVTSLPAQCGEAAILFDPNDVNDMATAIRRIWSDEPLRRSLVQHGRTRVAQFDWIRTAELFRAHYRRVSGRQLTADDTALIAAEPII